jgi:hypothetical protein
MDVVDQLSVLVHLSRVDKYVAPSESKLIHYIGALNGLSKDQIETLIDHPKPMPTLDGVNEDDRLEYLLNIVQLMKVDGKVFTSEIEFCEKIALKLGYLPGVIAELSQFTYADPEISTSKKFLRQLAQKHLIKK